VLEGRGQARWGKYRTHCLVLEPGGGQVRWEGFSLQPKLDFAWLWPARFDFYKIKEGSARVPRAESGVSPDSSAPSSVRRDAERDTPEACAPQNPAFGFVCKTVPHITLRSIAQNVALDAIFAKHQPILDEKLKALNEALPLVTPELRQKLRAKLLEKEKREGKKAVTDADRRRWLLPVASGILPDVKPGFQPGGQRTRGSRAAAASTPGPGGKMPPSTAGETPAATAGWREWEVPFDTDPDWPKPLQEALVAYRAAWRAKMDEVNACIAANAEQEELVDKPEIVRGVVRVSGPFTVEGVMPVEESLTEESPIGGAPEALDTFGSRRRESADSVRALTSAAAEPQNAGAYLDQMLRLLRADGVRFPNNKEAKFSRLEPVQGGGVPARRGRLVGGERQGTARGGIVWPAARPGDGLPGGERAAAGASAGLRRPGVCRV